MNPPAATIGCGDCAIRGIAPKFGERVYLQRQKSFRPLMACVTSAGRINAAHHGQIAESGLCLDHARYGIASASSATRTEVGFPGAADDLRVARNPLRLIRSVWSSGSPICARSTRRVSGIGQFTVLPPIAGQTGPMSMSPGY